MFKKLWYKLFGKWVQIKSTPVLKTTTTHYKDKDRSFQEHGILILEQNTKTGKERCYFERPNGQRESVGLTYAKTKFNEWDTDLINMNISKN